MIDKDYQQMKFAPNNNEASKVLFTGRTKNIEEIFKFILSGNCVALYGERKSGKTLTLEIIQEIINGNIEDYENNLIDQTLYNAIPRWKKQFIVYKAIYVSFHGIRTEEELVNKFIDEVRRVEPFLSSNLHRQDRLNIILGKLQISLLENNQRLIVLLDEMEILGDFEQGDAIAELFCDRKNYSKIFFVHTGSYLWRERVSSKGSLFTHLESCYLKSIDENDMENYLLKPLSNDEKLIVTEMSGGKPLYAQYMAKIISESGALPSENELLRNTNIGTHIERNIYKEKRLDNDTKNILAALAYHSDRTEDWIAKKLKINAIITRSKITNLVKFGTVSESKGKYRIVGKLIERYGKEITDDPCRADYLEPPKSPIKRATPVIRWVLALTMLILAITLYSYTNPPVDSKTFDLNGGVVILNVPTSVEANEKGKLIISFSNNKSTPVESIKILFQSPDIQYDKDGRNSITFSNINPQETNHGSINYWVQSGNIKSRIKTEVFIISGDEESFSYEINRRSLPLKQYAPILSVILTILSILIPGKYWISILLLFKQLFHRVG